MRSTTREKRKDNHLGSAYLKVSGTTPAQADLPARALGRDRRLIWVNLCSYVEFSTSLRAVKLEDKIARPLIAHIAHAMRFSRRIKNGPARPQRLA
jgi:hypothetical protein